MPQREQIIDSKQLIYEGFGQALTQGVPFDAAGILVDEQFGAAILRDACPRGCVTALSVEQSGADEFEFEYGADFARHIAAFDPTFAKVLVRYNPECNPALNRPYEPASHDAQPAQHADRLSRHSSSRELELPDESVVRLGG